jgi:DNA-binding CsgD family transcriptional regulator
MGSVSGALQRGRDAFDRRAWADAHALLVVEASQVDDLERLAIAAHLVGRDDESVRSWERAHAEALRLGDLDRAVRCTFWLAIGLLLRGEEAQASGWLARAERLVGQPGGDGSGRGFLLVPEFLFALGRGDRAVAGALTEKMIGIAQRFDDRDLLALGVLSTGQTALAAGDTVRGVRLLDEAMVTATAEGVSPIVTGIVYCAVIEACMDLLDLRRAAQWTEAMHHWCAAQPDLVPYRGHCLVHRSQVLQACGDWPEAVSEAERARQRLSEPVHPALGLALYQQAELHRLRGELDAAERAYRAAGEHGREPAPGFALLRLAQGSVPAALAAVRRMVEESRGRLTRPVVLAAAVEVLLAAGETGPARAAVDELCEIAHAVQTPLLHAVADYATGAVLLAEDAVPAALVALRRACCGWRELDMPYDAARARVQIALACRSLGDHDASDLELHAAHVAFERLGALPDLARVADLAERPARRPTTVLTARECEVLRLVAAGRTNREVGAVLVISEHTVARHVQNIFAKTGVPSRAAATAYAYEHGLVAAPH